MWLRIGKRSRWKGAAVNEAAKDLTPRDGEDLSVFRVIDEAEAKKVATAFAMVNHKKPDTIDIVLLPESAFSTHNVIPRAEKQDSLPDYLSDRHYEVAGLNNTALRTAVARSALDSGAKSERLKKATLIMTAEQLDQEVREQAQPGWSSP